MAVTLPIVGVAPGTTADVSEYGGTYDTTTVDKVARVVVTIE